MLEIFRQVATNLRANKLRSFLTMFGILWGVISVVILSATGGNFRRGNDKVLQELGKNIAIVWGARTGTQAGGQQRAGRAIRLTMDDVHALQTESNMISVVSAEFRRGASASRARRLPLAILVDGIEPQYQDIRTIEVTIAAGTSRTSTRRRRAAWRSSAGIPTRSSLPGATASARRSR